MRSTLVERMHAPSALSVLVPAPSAAGTAPASSYWSSATGTSIAILLLVYARTVKSVMCLPAFADAGRFGDRFPSEALVPFLFIWLFDKREERQAQSHSE